LFDRSLSRYIISLELVFLSGAGTAHGFVVDCVLSGEEALGKARQVQYDLAFIDYYLPGMNGVEVCRELKKVSPRTIMIFFTGTVGNGVLDKEDEFVKAGGRVAWLYKPFMDGELLRVAQEALSGKM
jgi:CheY-like chemotaxis protein